MRIGRLLAGLMALLTVLAGGHPLVFAQSAASNLRVANPLIRAPAPPPVTVTRTNYHGWRGSLLMRNASAEVIIVPAIGRVMQFRLHGSEGGFWENRLLDGHKPNPKSSEWGNFGGDKSWPAPQSAWPKITPRAWPPPVAFDARPVEAVHKNSFVLLTSPVDPDYGIQVKRQVELDSNQPLLRITTTYHKVSGDPLEVGIWVITQLKHPTSIWLPIPQTTLFPEGYLKQSAEIPPSLVRHSQFLSLERDPKKAYKIGSDTDVMLWIDEEQVVRISSPRQPGVPYPDGGCSAEVYTNPDPLSYVELETLGPLRKLARGESMSWTNTYQLFKRSRPTPEEEARAYLPAF